MGQDAERGRTVRLRTGGKRHERLRDRQSHRIGARDHGRLGDRVVLDQHALELERTDAVVGRLEQVVGSSDVGDVAVVVPPCHVAGDVVSAALRLTTVGIAPHQTDRASRVEREPDLAFRRRPIFGIEQRNLEAWHRSSHGPGLDRQARRVADLTGRLRLAVAVADRQAPGLLHALDDLRVQRLAGADQLRQLHAVARQVLVDEHPPHRRWRAQRRHTAALDRLQGRLRIESRLGVDEHRRPGVPRREEVAPGVLGPASPAS